MHLKRPYIKGFLLSIFLMILVPALAAARSDLKHPTNEQLEKIFVEFEKYALKSMQEWEVPGMAVAVVKGDKLIYSNAFGVKQLGNPDKVDVNTIFQVGSTSKAFTSALAAIMVDQGHFEWRDKVVSHLPDFGMYDPWVTAQFEVQDLMAQRSGLEPQVLSAVPIVGFDRKHVMYSMRYAKPSYSFRSEFSYINSAFLWAAALVEEYTNKTWEKNLEDHIFNPLGMKSSSSTMEEYLKTDNKSALHSRIDDRINEEVQALPWDWPYFDWVYTMGPAGSIGSNVIDISRWLRMHIAGGEFEGKRIVSRENLEYTHTPKTIVKAPLEGERLSYCLSWIYNTYEPADIIWHNGGTFGAKSIVSFMPEAGIGIIVLSNLRSNMVPEALAKRFYDLYFNNPFRDWSKEHLDKAKEAIAADPYPERPKDFLPPRSLVHYTGEYENEVWGKAEVTVENGALGLVVGPRKTKMILKPWNGDVFAASLPGFQIWADFVTFKTDPAGNTESLTIDLFNNGKVGTLTKIK